MHDDDTCTIMHASIMSKHRPLVFLRASDRSCDSERNELGGASESEFSLDISLDRNGARSDQLRIGFPRAIRGDRRFSIESPRENAFVYLHPSFAYAPNRRANDVDLGAQRVQVCDYSVNGLENTRPGIAARYRSYSCIAHSRACEPRVINTV